MLWRRVALRDSSLRPPEAGVAAQNDPVVGACPKRATPGANVAIRKGHPQCCHTLGASQLRTGFGWGRA